VMVPLVRPPVSMWLAAAALAGLLYSFAADVWVLWRQPAFRRIPAHP
jgi:hypothetical protein